MTVLFAFVPSAASAYIVRRVWQTEILTARDGTEQRRALATVPRLGVEFPLTLSGQCRRDFERFMVAGQREDVLLHDRSRSIELAAGMADDVVDVGAVPAWLIEGSSAILVHRARVELRTVDDVTGTTVTFAESGAAWPAGTRLFPALRARLAADIAARRSTVPGVLEVTLRADVLPGFEPAETAGVADATFDGREVWLHTPDRWLAVDIDFGQMRERVDAGFGMFADFHPVAWSAPVWQAQYTGCDAAAVAAIRAFVARMKAQRGEFFMPSFSADLVVALQAGIGTTTLTVEGDQSDFDGDEIHQAIAARLEDGSWQFNRVTAQAPSGDDTVLTMAAAWGAAIPTGARVSWMPLRRLASDTLEEQWITRAIGQTALAVRALPYVAAET